MFTFTKSPTELPIATAQSRVATKLFIGQYWGVTMTTQIINTYFFYSRNGIGNTALLRPEALSLASFRDIGTYLS